MEQELDIFGPSAPALILCCQCSTPIQPNAANMCVNCLKVQANIGEEISTNNTLEICQKCARVLQPPNQWISAELESKQVDLYNPVRNLLAKYKKGHLVHR